MQTPRRQWCSEADASTTTAATAVRTWCSDLALSPRLPTQAPRRQRTRRGGANVVLRLNLILRAANASTTTAANAARTWCSDLALSSRKPKQNHDGSECGANAARTRHERGAARTRRKRGANVVLRSSIMPMAANASTTTAANAARKWRFDLALSSRKRTQAPRRQRTRCERGASVART